MLSKLAAVLLVLVGLSLPGHAASVTAGNAVCFNDTIGAATKDCGVALNGSTSTTALTASGAGTTVSGAGTSTAAQIYQDIFAGATSYDAIRGVITANPGTTVTGTNAVAGYVNNEIASTGAGQNAVALFGVGIAGVNNSATWGINTLLMDSTSYVVGTGTGRILQNEFDYNVVNPGTAITGVLVTGASLSQPTSATGFSVGALSTGNASGVWLVGFSTCDGCATVAAAYGTSTTGNNVGSQAVKFLSRTAGGVTQATRFLSDSSGDMVLSLPALNTGFIVTGPNTTLPIFEALGTTTAVNYLVSTAAATNISPALSAGGSDSNINVALIPKGSGTVVIAPIPTSAGSGGLYVCIDNMGLTYKKSSCP